MLSSDKTIKLNSDTVNILSEAGDGFVYLRNGEKIPAAYSWKDADVSAEEAISWMNRGNNIGLKTGKIFVIDIDVEEKEEALKVIALLSLPPTWMVNTPRGGLHLYYSTKNDIGNSAKKLHDKVDTRGKGGYVLIPGCTIGNKVYTWDTEFNPSTMSMTELPSNIISKLAKESALERPVVNSKAPLVKYDGEMHPYFKKAYNEIIKDISECGEGSRNDTLYKGSIRLGELIHLTKDEENTRMSIISAGISAGLNMIEAEKTVESGFNKGKENPKEIEIKNNNTNNTINNTNNTITSFTIGSHLVKDLKIGLVFWKGVFWKWDNGYSEFLDHDLKVYVNNFFSEHPEYQKYYSREKNNVIDRMKSLLYLEDNIDDGTWLSTKTQEHCIAFSNRLLSIDKYLAGEIVLYNNTPDYFSLHAPIEYEFNPNMKDIPIFNNFLNKILPNKGLQNAFQELLGSLLTKDYVTQRMYFFFGPAHTGKSTILNLIGLLMGKKNTSNVGIEAFSTQFGLAPTVGKRVNICPELNDSSIALENKLKSYTGSDTITIDKKYKEPLSIKPTAKLIFGCNDITKFRDRSNGIYRRMVVLPMNVVIEEADKDYSILDKLANELPGVMNWALDGLRKLHNNGYNISETIDMKAIVEEHKRESNPTKIFIDDFCEVDTNERGAICKDVYDSYKLWAKENGYRVLSDGSFGKEISRILGVKKIRISENNNKKWVYQNVKVSSDFRVGYTEDLSPERFKNSFNPDNRVRIIKNTTQQKEI